MKKYPYMPLYINEYESASRHLEIDEEGVFFRLIRLHWDLYPHDPPDDDKKMARWLRVDPRTWRRVLKVLMKYEVYQLRDGHLVNQTLREGWEKVVHKSAVNSKNGKRGGRRKNSGKSLNYNEPNKANAKANGKANEKAIKTKTINTPLTPLSETAPNRRQRRKTSRRGISRQVELLMPIDGKKDAGPLSSNWRPRQEMLEQLGIEGEELESLIRDFVSMRRNSYKFPRDWNEEFLEFVDIKFCPRGAKKDPKTA